MTDQETENLLTGIASQLGEHFDVVQIMVSWNDQGLTYARKTGCGNWYARQGLAHEFINSDTAQEHARQLLEILPSPPEDGDQWKKNL